MGVEIPKLDDREYAAIVEEARKRIPVYSERWTDHNAHDPGITVLETLAWIAETYVYQLDRVTDAHREKYLRLMGAQPEPPEPASVRLKVRLRPSAAPTEQGRSADGMGKGNEDENGDGDGDGGGTTLEGERIAEGTGLVATDGTGVERRFETAEPVTLTAASVVRAVSEYREGRVDNSTANEADGMYFHPFGERAEEGSELYLGFDGDPFATADLLNLAIGFHETGLPEPASHGNEEPEFEPSVAVSWQYCTDYANWFLDESWTDLTIRTDGTNRFYRGGTVTLEKPTDWHPDDWDVGEATILDRTEALLWLRCRVETSGYEVPPRLDSIDTNVVEARHRSTVEQEVLRRPEGGDETTRVGVHATGGIGERSRLGRETTALPGQTFAFEHAPVLEAEIVVASEREGRDDRKEREEGAADRDDADRWEDVERWTEVADFDVSGPDDTHYVLDRSRGHLRFGNGVKGNVPEVGRYVVAERYVHGGGTSGNVPAASVFRFSGERYADGPLAVRALGPADGGRDAESITDALLRLRRDFETPYRAVSAADFEWVAEHTPGLRFGRTKALVKPEQSDGGGDDGRTVSVVTVPFSTLSKPEPSEGFLDAVRRHLMRHRLLTDRVAVEPPTYVGISVTADVRVAPGYREAGRAEETRETLDAFLDPLEGFDGEGWPFGRPLYTSEVYAVIEGVAGVDSVLDVSIAARGERTIDTDGSVLIGESALLYPEEHHVVARTGQSDGAGT